MNWSVLQRLRKTRTSPGQSWRPGTQFQVFHVVGKDLNYMSHTAASQGTHYQQEAGIVNGAKIPIKALC